MKKDQYIEMLEEKVDELEIQKTEKKMLFVVLWVIIWMIISVIFYNNYNKGLIKDVVEQKTEQKEETACFWCYTLVDGHCKDDTNWSKWCYSNFEWERPENDYYD